MKRGEIWDVQLPPPPGGAGHEQAGIRPAVIANVEPDPGNRLCVVIPCTSQMEALRLPHTLRVDPSSENGLTVPTVVLVFQLRALDRRRILQRRGRLEQDKLREIENILRELLGL